MQSEKLIFSPFNIMATLGIYQRCYKLAVLSTTLTADVGGTRGLLNLL